ncbi:MAG TPA: CsbD family protein [Chloroflexota bacterium]
MKGEGDKAAGTADRVKGKTKKAVGQLTGNNDLKAKGDADKAKGSTKRGVGRVKDAAQELTT